MKYSLRSLMILAIVLPPLLAVASAWVWSAIAPLERAEDSYGPGPPGQLEKAVEKYEEYLRNQP